MACFGCNWRCIYARAHDAPVKCIADVDVESVWREVDACLAAS
jgi:hypothetical protein